LCSQYMMWINVFSIFSAILPWHSKSTRKEGACKINLNVLSWIRRDFSRWFFFFNFKINKLGFYFYLWICCNIVYYRAWLPSRGKCVFHNNIILPSLPPSLPLSLPLLLMISISILICAGLNYNEHGLHEFLKYILI
jgi:hypothetical protein